MDNPFNTVIERERKRYGRKEIANYPGRYYEAAG